MQKLLNELATITYGADYKKNSPGDSVPIIGTGGLMGYTSVPLNQGPAVLTGRKGSINRPIYVEGAFWNVDTIFCVKAKPGVDTKWLYYNLLNTNLELLNEATGVPSVSASALYRLKFTHFDYEVQRKIAHILSTLDGVIARTEAVIAKYTAIKAGLLQDLFTRGIGVNGQLRPSPQQAPDLYKESPLGLIPKEWEVEKFEKVTNQIIDGTHFTPNYVEYGVPFLRVTDVQNTTLNPASFKYITPEEHAFLTKRCKPEKGDILYSKNGTIGVPKLVDWNFEFSVFVSLALIKPKHERIDKYYLLHLLRHDVIWNQIRIRAKQGTVTNLHLEEIREFDIPLPDKSEQKLIAERIGRINSNIQTEQAYLTKLQGIRAGLMADLLRGKVDVTTAQQLLSTHA